MRNETRSKGFAVRRPATVVLVASALLMFEPVTTADQAKRGTVRLPADLAWVSPDVAGFLTLRPAQLWEHAAFKPARVEITEKSPEAVAEFTKQLGAAPADVERLTIVMPRLVPGNTLPLFYVRTAKPYEAKNVLVVLGPDAQKEKRGGRVLHAAKKDHRAISLFDDRSYVVGETGEVQSLLDRGPAKADGPLSAALRAADQGHVAVLAANPATTMAVVGDKLPPQVDPFRPLLESRAVLLTVDADKWLQANLRFQFDKADAAREGARALQALSFLSQHGIDQGVKELGKENEKVVELLKEGKAALQAATVEARGTEVLMSASVKSDLSAAGAGLLASVRRMREAAARTQGANNLKQLALAMHNYHSTYNRFPPAAIYSKDGQPLLSWRVLILPYIEQDKLYKQFHLDEPWDSEHNKKLLDKMPKTYAAPEVKAKPGETYYLGFVGKGAFFEGKKGTAITDITDGTSNTILIVESANPVPWSKPEDLPFDPSKELPKVGFRPTGLNAAFCDGSVHFLKSTIAAATLKALITRNGGEVIGNDF